MNLYRDLGVMPLDSRGVWIDDVATCDCNPPRRPPQPHGTARRPPGNAQSNSPQPRPSRLPQAACALRGPRKHRRAGRCRPASPGGGRPGGWYFFGGSRPPRADLVPHTVQYEKLQLDHRRARHPGVGRQQRHLLPGQGRRQGQHHRHHHQVGHRRRLRVKKGDKLVELDDSGLQDQLKTQKIDRGQGRGRLDPGRGELQDRREPERERHRDRRDRTSNWPASTWRSTWKASTRRRKTDIEGRMHDRRVRPGDVGGAARPGPSACREGLPYVTPGPGRASNLESQCEIALKKCEEEQPRPDGPSYGIKRAESPDQSDSRRGRPAPWTASRGRPRPRKCQAGRRPRDQEVDLRAGAVAATATSRTRSRSARSTRRRTAWSSTTSRSRPAAAAARSSRSSPRASRCARARS